MKPAHWIVLIVTLIAATWFVYRTRDAQPRVETVIDFNWRFIQGDQKGAESPVYDDSWWRIISIPHDWMIEYPVDHSNPSGLAGGHYPGGIGWYRKILDLSEYEEMDQFYLVFEGVYMNADVWFNGTHLGNQTYGYASFYHDISSLVRDDSLNVIAVRTDCSELPVDRWYSGAGIYRHVRLIAANSLHVPVWGTWVTSEIDSTGSADLNISVEILNSGKRDQRFEIRYDVVDPKGRLVAEGNSSQFVEAGQKDTATATFHIEEPLLWSPETPEIYAVNCYLMERNKLIDHVTTRHGFRTIAFDPGRGFILNGEKVMMKGVNLHHEHGDLGAAVPVESWRRRFEILKELGVNALRLAHNPHAPEVLDLCDEMGFLVIDEMYDKWEMNWSRARGDYRFAENWETDLTEFIRRDRNHPSVVLWSVGNETVEQLEDPQRGIRIYRELKQLVNDLDPTRRVTCAMHPGTDGEDHEWPSSMMFVSDIVTYNYRTDSFRIWHEQYPELVFIAAETRAYATNPVEDYQVIDFADNSWNDMEEYVAGHFIWSGFDYLGESAMWPDRGCRVGLALTNGFIKPHAWYIGSRYREDPMVKLTVKDSLLADSLNNYTHWHARWAGAPLADHWTFGKDSSEKEVVVFTNCEKVDLHLNDRLVSTLNRNEFHDGVIRSSIPYEEGKLVATAYYKDDRDREQKVTDTLTTATSPYTLAMNPDRQQLRANSGEVVHITTEALDSKGTLHPHSSQVVSYQLEGPGRIRVIDNGDLADHTPAGSSSRKLKKGKQLLILQAGSEPGDLIISATADGLKPSSVKIKTKE